jgi:SAM-dependent methyltransferase
MDRLERYRRRYATLAPGWEPATARYQARVTAYLTPETRVLDLGCGRGGIVERLGATGHWCGVDPDEGSLQEHRTPALPRACAEATHLPFADGVFDLVTSSWVLEHLPDPALTLAEIARVLRPGGRFIFLTPNARHPLPWLGQRLGACSGRSCRGLRARGGGCVPDLLSG